MPRLQPLSPTRANDRSGDGKGALGAVKLKSTSHAHINFTGVQLEDTSAHPKLLLHRSPPRQQTKRDVLLYVTTHLSTNHFRCWTCWPHMLGRLQYISRHADLTVYAGYDQLKLSLAHVQAWLNSARSMLPNGTVRFFAGSNPGYESGAKLALQHAAREGWFNAYSWVIRVNPDVLVLDEAPLVRWMKMPDVSGVFANCVGFDDRHPEPYPWTNVTRHLHTDFTAFRPSVLPRGKDAYKRYQSFGAAEWVMTKMLEGVVKNGSDAYIMPFLPYDNMSSTPCRVKSSSIWHAHDQVEMGLMCGAGCAARWADPLSLWYQLDRHAREASRALQFYRV